LTDYGCAQEPEFKETIKYIELEVNENGAANVTQQMELRALENVYRADIIIPKSKNVEVYDIDSGIKLEYGLVDINDHEIINFYFSEQLNPGEKKNITINYETEFFTNKRGDKWELSLSLNASNSSMVKVIFPKNVIISFTSSKIIPLTYVENGRQVLELESAGEEIDFLCEYSFMELPEQVITLENKTNKTEQLIPAENETKINGTPANETQANESPANEAGDRRPLRRLAVIVILITVIILIAAAAYYFKSKKSKAAAEKQKQKTESEEPEKQKAEIKEPEKQRKVNPSIIGLLDENEKSVVELLQSTEYEITQAYIRKITKIPGSTLSKVMLRLEGRNIIERREEGKTKWVKLKEWIFR
jgi:uncharacterized membrane protein